LRSSLKKVIGNGFLDHDACDLLHHIVHTFQMLDIQGRVDVNSSPQEFEDVLVSFGVTAARGVGMGQFVH
jgi:hypothetical protein